MNDEIKKTEIQKEPIKEIYRTHLKKTFDHYFVQRNVEGLNGAVPRDESGVLHALSVGCGFGYEVQPLLQTFPNTQYRGIDTSDAYIKGAQGVNKDVSAAEAVFALEDARIVSDEEREKYGLVVIRHPQVTGTGKALRDEITRVVIEGSSEEPMPTQDWQDILKASIDKTAVGGYMFISAVEDTERARILNFLQRNDIMPLIDEPNSASQIREVYNDNLIIVGKKLPQEE